MVVIFGLYHVPYNEVEQRILNAKSMSITHFDTAQLYGNERICGEICNETDVITSKIYAANTAGQVDKLVKRSLRRFMNTANNTSIDCMLLHRPMPHECWGALSKYSNNFKRLGISNYDINSLKSLLEYCETMNLRKPDVHQIEVHPFVNCDPLIVYCKNQGMTIQGHTILAQGKFFNSQLLVNMATKYSTTPAAILTAWAFSKNIDICVGSGNVQHLQELVSSDGLLLSDEDIEEMNSWHKITPHRFYDKLSSSLVDDQDAYINRIVDQLKKDKDSDYPSDTCECLPLAGESYRSLGKIIAAALFPERHSESSLTHYRTLIKTLRRKRIEHRKSNILYKKGLTCSVVR